MSPNRTRVPISVVMAGMFLLACGACSNCVSKESQAGDAGEQGQDSGTASAIDQSDSEDVVIIGESHEMRRFVGPPVHAPEDLRAVPAELDVQNRFFAAVIVFSFPPSTPMGSFCTGIRVAPRLILTAGNCVCDGQKQPAPGGGQQTVIDATSCATSAEVRTVSFEPPRATGAVMEYREVDYEGVVRPHPSLKIVLNEQGNIVSSEADLAAIQIPGPKSDGLPSLALADDALRVNEPLVMVGYDAWDGPTRRRSRQYHVTQILDAGARALYDQPRRDVYKGDSGGPCLRVTDRGMTLAGILNRSLGAEASFTSTFHYRDWIRQELQRVADESASSH